MRPFRGAASLCALAVLVAADTTAQAAWNNVFQVSCFRRRCCRAPVATAACCPAPVVVAAAPPCPAPCPCPQPVCTTQYVQRCYYQPVTSYTQRTYYEPVTTYRTSYYYEPVCSYRYSCYYDPCTCAYQQVATPVTSYRLRSQCNAVTSYLQRCQMVPVTSYQLKTYYEPVTTCCTPACTPCCNPAPACPPPAAAVGTVPAVPVAPAAPAAPAPAVPAAPAPGVGEQQQQQQQPVVPSQKPRVGEQATPGGAGLRRYQETQPPPIAGTPGGYRQPQLRTPVAPVTPTPPRVRLDRIAALPGHNLEGRVVSRSGRAPQPGARLLFVSADTAGRQQSMTADAQGRFRATLDSGNWLVYVRDGEGAPVFQEKVGVNNTVTRHVTLMVRR